MQIRNDQNLSKLTSLQIGGTAKFFCSIESSGDIQEVRELAKANNLPIVVIGGGTNTIFPDGDHDKIVIKNCIKGKRIATEFDKSVIVEVGAGEDWDEFVEWAVKNKFSGIETLSAIPGTVGASPVQNIGAYGTELSDTFVRLEAYEIETGETHTFGLTDCAFEYRDSIFKRNPGKFIITKVALELSKKEPKIPTYKDIQLHFLNTQEKPTLNRIRNAIIEIRRNKLPNPSVVPNAGSFFKNTFTTVEHLSELLKKYPEMPHFQTDNGLIKIYSGWLIEQAGFKGITVGNVGIHKDNALVVTTNGEATFKELFKFQKEITRKINDKFGIELEIEPVIIE